jgi:hypothetical protein
MFLALRRLKETRYGSGADPCTRNSNVSVSGVFTGLSNVESQFGEGF